MVGLGAGVGDAQLGASVSPDEAAASVTVVDQYSFDCDAFLSEPGNGTVQERHAVDGVFCSGKLAVGEPRVGVDRCVDVGVTQPGAPLGGHPPEFGSAAGLVDGGCDLQAA